MGFDPLVASNWYKFTYTEMQENFEVSIIKYNIYRFVFLFMYLLLFLKGIQTVLKYHDRSHIKALLQLFPDIGLDKNKFPHLPGNFYLLLFLHLILQNIIII